MIWHWSLPIEITPGLGGDRVPGGGHVEPGEGHRPSPLAREGRSEGRPEKMRQLERSTLMAAFFNPRHNK